MVEAQRHLVRAIDSHCHVLDPARFAYSRDAAYRPPATLRGTVEDFVATLDAHGVSHALLVSPTAAYNHDNSYLIDTLFRFPDRFRGIARLPFDIDLETMQRFARQGVIGVRADLIGDGLDAIRHPHFDGWLTKVERCQWLLQVQCEKDQLTHAAPALTRRDVRLLIDHCGRPDPALGVAQRGFQTLLALGREGHFVKLSGAFRFSLEPAPHADCDRFVAALLDAFTPQRCVWGSDWPFLRMEETVSYARALDQLHHWVPDAHCRQTILSITPSRLFGFA